MFCLLFWNIAYFPQQVRIDNINHWKADKISYKMVCVVNMYNFIQGNTDFCPIYTGLLFCVLRIDTFSKQSMILSKLWTCRLRLPSTSFPSIWETFVHPSIFTFKFGKKNLWKCLESRKESLKCMQFVFNLPEKKII